jgi:hypothetical protein
MWIGDKTQMNQNRFASELLRAMLFCALTVLPCGAQTEEATISGRVTDTTSAVVRGATVQLLSADNGTVQKTSTNGDGIYVFPAVRPGVYHISVRKEGFRELNLVALTANVQAHIEQNFQLRVGAVSESITITADAAQLVNTEDATVSTVVGSNLVQNLPLNGRSIQTLLMLTPGVQFTEGGTTSSQGQFSVNGQRTDANYFTVDGVAANLGTDLAGNGLPEAAAGSVAGWNALGGTNGLVSVDAIQEFRVQTSTYSAEFGRTPGAQVGIVTRSGANAWHGSAFEYLRNDLLDASDWFNGYTNHPPLPKPEERSNDFGGVLGGPIIKDHSFFFFSYEGLRLRQPVTLMGVVPDATARTTAPADLQPLLNAFPNPNGAELTDNLASFTAAVSNPATLNSYSLRVDQSIGSKSRLFVRYAYSPSSTSSAGSQGSAAFSPNSISESSVTTHTFTAGLDQTISNKIANELRVNYSNLKSFGNQHLSSLGGAVPLSTTELSQIFPSGVDPSTAQLDFSIGDGSTYFSGPSGVSEQRQVNLTDNVSVVKGPHLLKFGVDFRYLAPFKGVTPYFLFLFFNGMNGAGGVLTGQTAGTDVSQGYGVSTRSKNLSLYAEDRWKATDRLTFTYGLRWELNPAPYGANLANDPLVVQGLNNPATLNVAPRGTPFYSTTYRNFAPRFAAAYSLRAGARWQTVVRGGIGTFYDIGSGSLGTYVAGYPFSATNFYPNANYPLTAQQLAPPTVNLSGPVGLIFVADPNLALPRTYQWNAAVEQSLGQSQTLSVTYLGTLGRQLLRTYNLYPPSANFTGAVDVTANSGFSDYQALQIKFQRQVAHGVQVLASYAYAHSIDNASNDVSGYAPRSLGPPSIDRGNSDFDVRHSMSGALTYDLPQPGHGAMRAILGGWSVQDLIFARSAFPVDLQPFNDYYFIGPYPYVARPNVVPGVPFYLYSNQYPGGKVFNPAAFTDATPGTEGDLGRNTLRGFGCWQDNFALHRQFALTEKLNLQFRVEAFNILNHPNFADPSGGWPISFPEFGISTSSLAGSLGAAGGGGLNPLYQIGGPRSWQFGLKLQF